MSTRTLAQRSVLETDGYLILRSAVEPAAVEAALRMLNLAIRREGLTPEQIETWHLGTFFPHLRWQPEVWAALPPAAAELLGWQDGDEWAEPQLLLRFPDDDQPWLLQPHLDALPPWAAGRSYRGIVGVALTPAGERDGSVHVWPGSHLGEDRPSSAVHLAPGDALLMHPGLGHSGTLNLGGRIRCAVYFRLLAGCGAR